LTVVYQKAESVFKQANTLIVGEGHYEIQAIRAMEVDEREARYHTAVLEEQLQGIDEQQAFRYLTVAPGPGVRLYRLQSTSAEVKLEADDFLWALAPAGTPGFLEMPSRLLCTNIVCRLTQEKHSVNVRRQHFLLPAFLRRSRSLKTETGRRAFPCRAFQGDHTYRQWQR
jgi:hypothetical protein